MNKEELIERVIKKRVETFPPFHELIKIIEGNFFYYEDQIDHKILHESGVLTKDVLETHTLEMLEEAYKDMIDKMAKFLRELLLAINTERLPFSDPISFFHEEMDEVSLFAFLLANQNHTPVPSKRIMSFLLYISNFYCITSIQASFRETEKISYKLIQKLNYHYHLCGIYTGNFNSEKTLELNPKKYIEKEVQEKLGKESRQATIAKRWKPLELRVKEWEPVIDELANENFKHSRIAKELMKRKGQDGYVLNSYADASGIRRDLELTTVRKKVKERLKEIGRQDLITGTKRG